MNFIIVITDTPSLYISGADTVPCMHAALTSFGIRVQSWSNGISFFTSVSGNVPIPLGFGFQHPSTAVQRLTASFQPRVARRNLVCSDSIAASSSILWTHVAGSTMMLLLVYTGYLRSAVIVDLLSMIS